MKKKAIASILILCLTLSSAALLFSCAEQPSISEGGNNTAIEPEEEEIEMSGGFVADMSGINVSSIEELENMLIFARLMEKAASADDADARIEELKALYLYNLSAGAVSNLLAGYLEEFCSVYTHIPVGRFRTILYLGQCDFWKTWCYLFV